MKKIKAKERKKVWPVESRSAGLPLVAVDTEGLDGD